MDFSCGEWRFRKWYYIFSLPGSVCCSIISPFFLTGCSAIWGISGDPPLPSTPMRNMAWILSPFSPTSFLLYHLASTSPPATSFPLSCPLHSQTPALPSFHLYSLHLSLHSSSPPPLYRASLGNSYPPAPLPPSQPPITAVLASLHPTPLAQTSPPPTAFSSPQSLNPSLSRPPPPYSLVPQDSPHRVSPVFSIANVLTSPPLPFSYLRSTYRFLSHASLILYAYPSLPSPPSLLPLIPHTRSRYRSPMNFVPLSLH